MRNIFIVISLLFCTTSANSQSNEIVGFAPSFVGKKVELYAYQDFITMTKIKLAEGIVSPADSVFHLPVKTGATFKGLIQIEKTEASLYIAPNTSYDVYFPQAEDQAISFINRRTDLMFFGLDTTDINYRILQYNQWFDSYVAYHEIEIARGQFLTYLDTFMIYAEDAYKNVEDEYFITYVRYNIGEMQQTFGGNSRSSKRLQTFLGFIEPFPVYFENDQYMKFFKGFYSQGFEDFPPTIEAEINLAILNASPTRLMAALKQDLFLSNPEIREVVMIDQLGKQFYKRNDQKRPILIMLDSISNHAVYSQNATIARNVQKYLTSLEPGFPAPMIQLADRIHPDKQITWRTYEGKFVYFNFFETWNDQAKADMRIIADMKKKYGDYVSFLSVCTDKNEDDFRLYMAEHPEFDWDIVYIGAGSPLKSDYRVQVVPSYFLIDQSGFIAIAPAPTPSPDGEYESIDKTFFFIKKALTPTDGKRIGEP